MVQAAGVTDLTRTPFGTLPDGRVVDRFVLAGGGAEVAVLTYGAVLHSVVVPDRFGTPGDVTLGYDDLAGYLADTASFGAVVGRFGNRIAGGRFELDATTYDLPRNNGPHCLHGGPDGFSHRLWSAEEVQGGVALTLVSPDGDQGFPGTLTATVTYTLSADGLRLDYAAHTDAPTVLNLTNHAYWNLDGAGTAEHHEVEVRASSYVPVDETAIPLGDTAAVAGTPLDFRLGKPLGAGLRAGTEQLVRSRGYDHTLVLDREPGAAPSLAAQARAPRSGRVLEVLTDQPGVQLYSANFLDGTVVGKGSVAYRQGDALCLETQHFPDSPNQPAFPSTVLRPGEQFRSSTILRFGTE